jgi:hypothetical protein
MTKAKAKAKDKSKGEKLDAILEKLSRIESNIRKLSKQQDGVDAEVSKVLSVLKALQSRAIKNEKGVTKPVTLRSVAVTKPPSGAPE